MLVLDCNELESESDFILFYYIVCYPVKNLGSLFEFSHIVVLQFAECMNIGRDLIRVLQAVARIPEIEAIWKTMNNNPTSLDPSFTGK